MPASILAEPRRRKEQLSIDPQNLYWRNSSNNFGKKILEKMGWQNGKGVGKNEQGTVSNIFIKPNCSGKGLSDGSETCKEVWNTHNEDFEDILTNLNKQKANKKENVNNVFDKIIVKNNTKEIEKKRKRVKRNVFVKHISQCNDYEKACIFGLKSKKTKEFSTFQTTNEASEILKNNKNITVSKLTSSDYFTEKMKIHKLKKMGIKQK